MRFYTKQHRYYCGIDLHARSMYVYVLDPQGEIPVHRNMPCAPDSFLKAIAPSRGFALVVDAASSWLTTMNLDRCLVQGVWPSTRNWKPSQSAVTSASEAVTKANGFSSTEVCALDNRGPHKCYL